MKYSVSLDSEDWDFVWSVLSNSYEGLEGEMADSFEQSRKIMHKIDLAATQAAKRHSKVDHSGALEIIAKGLDK